MSDDLTSLAPIYARLTAMFVDDLMRTQGLSREDAEKKALTMTLGHAQDLVVGMEELDEKIDKIKDERKTKQKQKQNRIS